MRRLQPARSWLWHHAATPAPLAHVGRSGHGKFPSENVHARPFRVERNLVDTRAWKVSDPSRRQHREPYPQGGQIRNDFGQRAHFPICPPLASPQNSIRSFAVVWRAAGRLAGGQTGSEVPSGLSELCRYFFDPEAGLAATRPFVDGAAAIVFTLGAVLMPDAPAGGGR